MTVLVLATGGTIDKEYTVSGDLVIGDPQAPGLLALVRSALEVRFDAVLRKDSLEIDDADRAAISAAVAAAPEERIVLTHGTDTMTETADVLLASADLAGKTVVLTGAMQPARMRDSDAGFNLGLAVGAVQLLPPGVYVAMSGRVFPAGTVVKDRAAGVFHSA